LQFFICLAGVATTPVTGCTPAGPPSIVARPATFASGRILSMRPVPPPASGGPLRAVLFAGDNVAGQGAMVEFIVRTDGGATLSIVQDNGPGFHAGDRVVIVHGDRARLARPD
jgi:hypothetical protein